MKFVSPLSATARAGIKQDAKDTVHGREKPPLATPFTERRIEGADNARIRPLRRLASGMPYERGGNPPAASDLDAAPPISRRHPPRTIWADARRALAYIPLLVIDCALCLLGFEWSELRRESRMF
jgi:hypothetical protein